MLPCVLFSNFSGIYLSAKSSTPLTTCNDNYVIYNMSFVKDNIIDNVYLKLIIDNLILFNS